MTRSPGKSPAPPPHRITAESPPPALVKTSRRGFLTGTAALGAALGVAASHQVKAADGQTLDQYKPTFFQPDEWAFILAATARLIPSEGEGPGAIETRVPVFIDLQMAGDYGKAADWYMEGPFDPSASRLFGPQTPLTPAEVYRQAIPVFDTWCQQNQGGSFTALTPEKQDAALTALSKDQCGLAPELKDFWSHLLTNTKEGYFSDPMYGGNAGMQAWTYIGFPGARGAFREWAGRPEAYPLGPVSISGERA